ncbi:MAG: glycosyltransferase, partial [Cyclobacteriaceae bacterium]|nr:glycosyltransferase [Cyclobacteriaceae bacterium]
MNVFYLPSWYPSASNPLYGIFNYEQVRMVAHHNPEGRMGVAVWGQGDDPYLLWSGQPVRSLRKWIATSCEPSEVHEGNIRTYFSPQFIWTRKVRAGNLPAIIRAVEQSFLRFRQEVGEIQIMHVMSAYPGALIAGYLASKYSVPFVTTVHMSPFPFSEFLDKKGRMRPFLAKPLAGSARLLAVSRASERQIRSHGFTKVDTLVNPVDDRFFSRVKNTRTA